MNLKGINLYLRLWGHIPKKSKINLLLVLSLSIIVALVEIAFVGSVVPLLSVLTTSEPLNKSDLFRLIHKFSGFETSSSAPLVFTIIFVFLVALANSMRLLLLWTQSRFCQLIGVEISTKMYKLSLCQPYHVHLGRNSSQVIATISTKSNTVVFHVILAGLKIISCCVIVFAVFLSLVFVNLLLTMLAFLGMSLFYLVVIFLTRQLLGKYSEQISLGQDKGIKILQEGLSLIKNVLIENKQNIYSRMYRENDSVVRLAQADTEVIASSPRYILEASGMISIAFLGYMISNRQGTISTYLPVMGVVALAAQRLLPLVQQIFNSLSKIQSANSSLEDVLNLLDQPLSEFFEKQINTPMTFDREIKIENVHFSYPNSEKKILYNIDLTIKRGSRVGIIGKSGSGKSTLLNLIMGLLEPTTGIIKVDGQRISQNNIQSWQENISHVSQNIHLSDSSIAENIAFGIERENIELEQVKLAAQKAQVSDYIERTPKKYDTIIGENGFQISGGERQRLSIARSLYKRSNVFFWDEATSSLDKINENLVIGGLDSLEMDVTIIMIAHKLSTLQNCDLIIEISEGSIIRKGKYQDFV